MALGLSHLPPHDPLPIFLTVLLIYLPPYLVLQLSLNLELQARVPTIVSLPSNANLQLDTSRHSWTPGGHLSHTPEIIPSLLMTYSQLRE